MEYVKFLITQRVTGFTVPDLACLVDEEAVQFFIASLKDAKFYLEYGSGGSTVMAAKQDKPFISVDSDKYYHQAVKKKISAIHSNQVFLSVDVGIVGPWGIPFLKSQSNRRMGKWNNYPIAPWEYIRKTNGSIPDLILIDGRFRAACALTSIKELRGTDGTTILVDDYMNRPHFHVIEKFARLEKMVGRMGVFSPKAFDEQEINSQLAIYQSDWR